jgi:hypothetical protein
MGDESRTCSVCGRRFTWSYSKQRDFREKKLDPPKRCPDCIETRAAPRSASPTREVRISTPAERDRRWEEARAHAQDAYDRLHPRAPADAPRRPVNVPQRPVGAPVNVWLALACIGVSALIVIVLYLLITVL